MKLPPPSGFSTLEGVAAWARRLVGAIADSWAVDHNADGSHKFPWVRPSGAAIVATNITLTARTLFKYQIVARTMTIAFDVTGTVAGAPALFTLTIPDNYRSADSVFAGACAFSDAGTPGSGGVYAVGGSLQIYKDINATAWSAGTTRVQGTVQFEVQ